MGENVKEIWKKIYALAERLAINKNRLTTLVEEIVGKRAETTEEVNAVLSFLRAVEKTMTNSTKTIDEAILEAKKEDNKDNKEKKPVQRVFDEQTDAEVEKIGEDIEEELVKEKTQEKNVVDDKMIEAEVEEEDQWNKVVEIDEGTFAFREEDDALLCKNVDNGSVYTLRIAVPECSCPSFQTHKQEKQECKHLKAAKAGWYGVKKTTPVVPAEIVNVLEKVKSGKKKERKMAKKEEIVAIEVLGKRVDLVVQIPQEIIKNEEKAVEMIKFIIGPNPKRADVIEEYGDIKEIAVDVVISLFSF